MPTYNQVAASGAATAAPKSRPRFFFRRPVLPGFGLSFGVSLFYLSIIVLLPLSALLIYVSDMSWSQYWRAISHPRVLQSYKVTVSAAFYSTVAATIVGFLIAWITSRYNFFGRRIIDALVDLPFALPTSVAGLTLATLFVPSGWLGQLFAQWDIKIAYAYPGILIAMTFTSLPFVVRIVQPVIEELGTEYEEVAQTLGANRWQIFWRVIVPPLIPATVTGASQAFIRSLGEFGAVIMIAGNIPFKTEVTSLMIFVRLQEFNYPAAAAIASVVLMASLLLLFTLQVVQGRLLGWQRQRL
ncbi:sulfate ABC transporter permease subunit CysT [Paenalcaligenes niemegkensis]|uniref:sulfate ABC transporter permease subunit CysT n=1 Tax=Paenalcaligenes niemegkensis TaxID=2895469 RepID=UPI001EE8CDA1|nr:sulfate ABC transporter permease subunit CysT [Paenalcaligenes niemegkensis]MCQ9618096.1 sulfate ABC transporter permease subunit CysT [Paenalcaligenes niemegkensis]